MKFKEIFEDEKIAKYGFELSQDYVMLRELGINMKNLIYLASLLAFSIIFCSCSLHRQFTIKGKTRIVTVDTTIINHNGSVKIQTKR